MGRRKLRLLVASAAVFALLAPSASAHDEQHGPGWHGQSRAEELSRRFLADVQPAQELSASSAATCTAGKAGAYPCRNVDLLSLLPLNDIGGGKGNDVWGWTDSRDGREYALMGRSTGTSFIDITDAANPVYLGNLPTTRFSSSWRDIKVHADHAFIVSEALNHGMQVFDLRQLRNVTNPPVTFSPTARYTGISSAHNLVIDEGNGFAYIVGSNQCSGGLHIVDITTPASPVEAGCYAADGYTHDAQCLTYGGPDVDYAGRQICVASNEDTVTVVDVTNKAAPRLVSRTGYAGSEYTHQGWLTEDQRYFLLDDELDEDRHGHNTRTYVWDMADLDAPVQRWTFEGTTTAIDHNQYVKGGYSYQADYRAGLRILDIGGIATGSLTEAGYFDIYPDDDAAQFNGAWSTYPYFPSGNVVISGIEQGLFVVRPQLGGNSAPTVTLAAPVEGATVSGASVPIEIVAADLEDAAGSLIVEWNVDGGSWQAATWDAGRQRYTSTWNLAGVGDGPHTVTARARDAGGAVSSDANGVVVDNVADGTIHVGDLEGTKNVKGKSGKWEALATVTVHDAAEAAVSGASVSGSWSTAPSLVVSGTTGSDGTVTFSSGTITGDATTFTVQGVTAPGSTYAADENHDVDLDSSGSSITITRT